MTDGTSFHGAPTARGRHDGPFILVVVLVVAGIALAIAKPWGAAGPPLASTAPRVAASGQPAASVTSPPVAVATHLAHPLPVAFTAPAPAGSSGWAGLDWSSLASDDPLGAVRAEVTLGATSVAIGDIPGSTSTTVWSSADGSHWQPIEDNTPTTFWPNISIVALATLPGKIRRGQRDERLPPPEPAARHRLVVDRWPELDTRGDAAARSELEPGPIAIARRQRAPRTGRRLERTRRSPRHLVRRCELGRRAAERVSGRLRAGRPEGQSGRLRGGRDLDEGNRARPGRCAVVGRRPSLAGQSDPPARSRPRLGLTGRLERVWVDRRRRGDDRPGDRRPQGLHPVVAISRRPALAGPSDAPPHGIADVWQPCRL